MIMEYDYGGGMTGGICGKKDGEKFGEFSFYC